MKKKFALGTMMLIITACCTLSNLYSQNAVTDKQLMAIINVDLTSLIQKDITSNNKTAVIDITGLSNYEDAENLATSFSYFGGVLQCNFKTSANTPGNYTYNFNLYPKAHLNYFLKLLVTFNINYVNYKGDLTRTDALRQTKEIIEN